MEMHGLATIVFGVFTLLLQSCLAGVTVDPNGYIVYCPCMGRFGNQADQFLGSLGFAHAVNRTLVLPAWVEYQRHSIKSIQVPFDTYFKVEPLREYHRVITMETFMKRLAPTIWPPGKRTAFCYTARRSVNSEEKGGCNAKEGNPFESFWDTYGVEFDESEFFQPLFPQPFCYTARRSVNSEEKGGCNAKEGNPFESFWDTYGVEFDESEFFQPLYYSTDSPHEMRRWSEQYLPSDFPVLAFTGPPAAFPVQEHHVKLHRYVQWSDATATKAQQFIASNIQERPFIGLHLRNGIDFKNACEHIKDSPSMFAAPQCVGYRSQYGTGTYQMCYPDDEAVVKQVKKEVKSHGAKTVFVATDDRDLISKFSKVMKKVKFVRQDSPADPMLDLAILGQGDHFIGNCISSFTAFVKRERDANQRSSSFWSFTPTGRHVKEEL